MPGTSARASRSSSHRPPAVTRVSGPRSSWVAPSTSSPLSRGTRYTDEPRTMPRTVRRRNPSGARSRATCPLIGRTGGTQSAGSPSMAAEFQPAASTVQSAVTVEPSARRTPPARSLPGWPVPPPAPARGPEPSPSPGPPSPGPPSPGPPSPGPPSPGPVRIPSTGSRISRTPARSVAASRARVSCRGSTEPSASASRPPRTEGSSMGSRRRHSRAVSRRPPAPRLSCSACSSSITARSSAS